AVVEPQIVVLVDADSDGARANAVGHLFEDFIGRLLALYGYTDPRTDDLHVTVRGIELDITARHQLAGHNTIVQCKAYTSTVKGSFLQQFVGRLTMLRLDDPEAHGFFIAIPRLVAEAQEQARYVMERDRHFKVLNSYDVVDALRQQRVI